MYLFLLKANFDNMKVMKEKRIYTAPQSEVVEMETVTPFLDTLNSGNQTGDLSGYGNTNVNDDE
jgi:hypothetical protein